TSPDMPSADFPSTHQLYDVIAVAGPDGASEQTSPRMTSIATVSLPSPAAIAIDTWYEFVVTSSVSTVWKVPTSTSASPDRGPGMWMPAAAPLTGPASAGVPHRPFGSLASSGQVQPSLGWPGGYCDHPGSQAPRSHEPALHAY